MTRHTTRPILDESTVPSRDDTPSDASHADSHSRGGRGDPAFGGGGALP